MSVFKTLPSVPASYVNEDNAMKLHLGCGLRQIPGYTHVDVVPHEHVDIVHSIDSLPMLADGAADTIYACHVLEHFERADVLRVLKEWCRVLKPGGVLRVAVPDFAACAKLYIEGKFPLSKIIGPIIGGQTYVYNYHYNVFDEATLAALLVEAGFAGVRRYDWRETEHADVDDFSQAYLPHMDKDNGTLISLNVAATKAVPVAKPQPVAVAAPGVQEMTDQTAAPVAQASRRAPAARVRTAAKPAVATRSKTPPANQGTRRRQQLVPGKPARLSL